MSNKYSARDLRERLSRYADMWEEFEVLRNRLDLKQEDIARMLKVSRQTVNAAVNLEGSMRVIEQGIEMMEKMVRAKINPFKMVRIEANFNEDDAEALVIQGKMGLNGSLILNDGLYGYVQDWVPEDEHDEAGDGILKLMTFPFMIFSKHNSPHGHINYGGEYPDEDYIECLDDLRLKSSDILVRVTKQASYKYCIRSISPY